MNDTKNKPPVNNTSPARRKLTRQTPLSKVSPSRIRRSTKTQGLWLIPFYISMYNSNSEQHANLKEVPC